MTAFARALSDAQNLWDAALLALNRHDGLSDTTPRDRGGEPYERWRELALSVRDRFRGREDASLREDDRDWIHATTADGTDDIALYALAWGIDLEGWAHFPLCWKAALKLDENMRYRLAPGDIYPVSDADLELPSDAVYVSRPSAKRTLSRGELPHLRVHAPPPIALEVVFDFSFEHELIGVCADLASLATVHPNLKDTEFHVPAGSQIFPIAVVNPGIQLQRIQEGVNQAAMHGPAIICVPELAALEPMIEELQRFLDGAHEYEDLLLVAGSFHCTRGGERLNLAEALVPTCSRRLAHRKLVRFTNELSRVPASREGIDEGRELVIFAGGTFRVAMLICKDFLEPRLAALVSNLGVNVLCVPAMSPETGDFPSRVSTFVADTQGFALVANGPLWWDKEAIVPAAIFGQPVEAQRCILWPAEDVDLPSVVVLERGTDLPTAAVLT